MYMELDFTITVKMKSISTFMSSCPRTHFAPVISDSLQDLAAGEVVVIVVVARAARIAAPGHNLVELVVVVARAARISAPGHNVTTPGHHLGGGGRFCQATL